jgi:hypothetical protein
LTAGLSVGQVTQLHGVQMEGLKAKWANLKRVLSGDNECYNTGEWKALEEELGPQKAAQAGAGELPPALPVSFPGDGQNVKRGKIVRSYMNKRLWQISILTANGRPGDLANLWVGVKTTVKLDWVVYVKPNPNESEEGYVLQGIYNKYGDRLE